MKSDTPYYIKVAVASMSSFGINLAAINEIITLVAGLMAITVSGIAIYKFLKNRKIK